MDSVTPPGWYDTHPQYQGLREDQTVPIPVEGKGRNVLTIGREM
jgi:hypothetical protein